MPKVTGQNPDRSGECSDCGCQFSFKKSEVRAGDLLPGSDDRDHSSVVTCPGKGCNRSVDVTSKVGITSYETAMRQAADDGRDYC